MPATSTSGAPMPGCSVPTPAPVRAVHAAEARRGRPLCRGDPRATGDARRPVTAAAAEDMPAHARAGRAVEHASRTARPGVTLDRDPDASVERQKYILLPHPKAARSWRLRRMRCGL